VKVLQAPNAKAYGNPKFGGAQATGGSQTTRAFFYPLRLVGAQTRYILIASASAMLGAPIDELTTEPNVVVHRATERKLSYGEIAANGRIPDPIPQVTLTDLKPATDWRYLGKDLPRIDIPSKVDGSACFGTDLLLPGMLYRRRCPSACARRSTNFYRRRCRAAGQRCQKDRAATLRRRRCCG
jgi:isoquinoline 1-oxidoreductase beta subunit